MEYYQYLYINCIYSFKEDIDKIQNKINKHKNKKEKIILQQRLDNAKEQLEKVVGLDEIFHKYLPRKSGKFVVFCKDKEHLRKMQQEVSKWFSKINKNVNISEVCYDISDANNKYTIDRFNNIKNNDINLLFSIDMLNEGLHVEDIDGVIMLRTTQSLIIYLQQFGRGLASGKDNPYIFDIANNFNQFYDVYDFQEELRIDIEKQKEKTTDLKEKERLDLIIKQFVVIEEYRKIVDILENINLDATFTWDDWYKLAKKYYEHHGDLIVPHRYKTKDGIALDEDGIKLGGWIHTLRCDYSNNKLSTEEIIRMNSIGMIWNDYYTLAKIYFENNGTLNFKARFKTKNGIDYDSNGLELGTWLQRQKTDYVNKKLSSERIKKLEDIGIIWNLKEDKLLRSKMSDNEDEVTEYLCNKLNMLLNDNYEFKDKKDVDKLNQKLNDSIYIAKRR